MITVFTGANSLTLQAALQRELTAFVGAHGDLAVERLDGEEATFERMQEAMTSLPFLSDKKMIVLRAPGANKQFVAQIERLASDVPDTNEVIIIEPKLDKRGVYYKFLKRQSVFTEYRELDSRGLAQWLSSQATERGGVLSVAEAQYLAERLGGNQQQLSNELDKLLLHHTTITRDSIDLLTEASPQSTIFQLLEAAFAGNRKHTLELYKEQRALKVEPQQIIAMVGWQLHILAIIKTAGQKTPDLIAQEAKISPFVVRKSQTIARALSLARLKGLVTDLMLIDVRSKRSALDLDEALQHYLLTLA